MSCVHRRRASCCDMAWNCSGYHYCNYSVQICYYYYYHYHYHYYYYC